MSAPFEAYEAFLRCRHGLYNQATLLARLETQLLIEKFEVRLDSPEDLKTLSPAVAKRAAELLPELQKPGLSASDIAHLI